MFDSARGGGLPSRDIAGLVSQGLGIVSAKVSDITAIAVNIGPGGLSYVRSGVSFVNALAFSLGVPIYPFSYFAIIASQARRHTALPILCAVPAAGDQAYVSLVSGGSAGEAMRFGPLAAVLAEMSGSLTEIAIAGRIRHRLSVLLPHVTVVDTGIEKPDANVLFEMAYLAREQGVPPVAQANPLNEQAAIFYERAYIF
jgi:tRNA threonylcarbamoyladenosine biosynthesis protein TsaB